MACQRTRRSDFESVIEVAETGEGRLVLQPGRSELVDSGRKPGQAGSSQTDSRRGDILARPTLDKVEVRISIGMLGSGVLPGGLTEKYALHCLRGRGLAVECYQRIHFCRH